MAGLQRGDTSDAGNPVLEFYVQLNGSLSSAAVVTFSIWDISSAGLEASPVQVYPPSGTTAATDLGGGHYVAVWTVPLGENVGAHQLRVFVTPAGEATTEQRLEFEVLSDNVFVPVGTGSLRGKLGGTPMYRGRVTL